MCFDAFQKDSSSKQLENTTWSSKTPRFSRPKVQHLKKKHAQGLYVHPPTLPIQSHIDITNEHQNQMAFVSTGNSCKSHHSISSNTYTLIATSEPSWGDKCDACVSFCQLSKRGKTNMTWYDDRKLTNKHIERESGKAYESRLELSVSHHVSG